MQYLKLSIVALFFATIFISCEQKTEEQQAPNVIYIFPDQYRQFSLGFWSQDDNAKYIQGEPDPVSTPALDKLAKEAVVFNRAISNFPLCSPYRGMLMSGQYPHTNGLTANCHKNRTIGIKADGKAMADVFADAGYETAYFGKCHWHQTRPVFDENGDYQGTTDPPGGHYVNNYDTYVPPGDPRLGFKYFFQTLRDSHSDPLCYSNDSVAVGGLKDGELYQPGIFNAKLEAEVLLDYLKNNRGQRDESKPFFITWSLNPPHNPWTEEHTDMRFFPQYTDDGEVNIDKLLVRDNANKKVGEYTPYYFANVSAVDHYIGMVIDQIEEMGETDNTIIVFTSDHGEMLGSHDLRGKLKPEAEAMNIPLIIKWGNKLKHRVDDLMLSVPDMMPTLLALAGLEEYIPEQAQGKNYAKVILNPESADVKEPESVLYMDYNSRGLYTGDYTFIVQTSDKVNFVSAFYYDNVKDPYQLHPITGDEMDMQLVENWKKDLVAKLKAIDDKWAQDKICDGYLNY
jgi:arylsulfatase A-like enzyme